MASVNIPPMRGVGTVPSPNMPRVAPMRQMASIPVRHVPTPQEAMAPEPEAVSENEVLPSEPAHAPTKGIRLNDARNYVNDLTEEQIERFVKPLRDKFREKTVSANVIANALCLTHSRITRNFPDGTKLSEILAANLSPRIVTLTKLMGRLSHSDKETLRKLLEDDKSSDNEE